MNLETLRDYTAKLDALIPDSKEGLDYKLFLLVSRLTPLVNVDLLVQNNSANVMKTLLTWRDDGFYRGWHIPGGIIRFKESFQSRLLKVARNELNAEVEAFSGPIAINEKINPTRDVRGHFVSLLFRVSLLDNPEKCLSCKKSQHPTSGCWEWFERPPKDLIYQHRVYERFFSANEQE